jgi:hypothetical protein
MRFRRVTLDRLLHHPQKTENRNHGLIPSQMKLAIQL